MSGLKGINSVINLVATHILKDDFYTENFELHACFLASVLLSGNIGPQESLQNYATNSQGRLVFPQI